MNEPGSVVMIRPEQNYQVQEMSVEDAVARFDKIELLSKKVLKEGAKEGTGDYGIFPGTKQKVLFKAGAEKLCTVFRLGAHYSIESCQRETDGHVIYLVRCVLRNQGNGIDVGSALGLCSSKETKYRYRNSGRKCPECGLETIIKGKAEYGGGWVCFKAKGGCGAKFKDGDAKVEGQQPGKVENPDIADVENTVLKMAEKRAHVAATLNALGISSLFTQDIIQDNSEEPEPESKPARPQQQAKTGQQSTNSAGGYSAQQIEEIENNMASVAALAEGEAKARVSKVMEYVQERWQEWYEKGTEEQVKALVKARDKIIKEIWDVK